MPDLVGIHLAVGGQNRNLAAGISRTQSGLILSDDFVRAGGDTTPGANWTIESGSWDVTAGKLRALTVNATSQIIRANVALRLDWHVQLTVAKSVPQNYATLQLRRYTPNGPGDSATVRLHMYDNSSFTDGTDPNKARVHRFRDGVLTKLGVGVTNLNTQDQVYRYTCSRIGTNYDYWIDGALQVTGADANNVEAGGLAINCSGQGGAAIISMDDFVACSGRTFQVSGLQIGQKIRCGSVTTAGADGTGILQVDLGGQLLPQGTFDVLNPANAVLATYTGAIYGGDQYTVAL